MTRTRLAGCLALFATSATALFASAEVTCPGSVIYPNPTPPDTVMPDPSMFDPSYRPLGSARVPGTSPDLDRITFRYDEAGADRIAPRIPIAPRDPAMMHVTFSPGSTPKVQPTALVGSAYASAVGADPAFARSPGALMMLTPVDTREPAGYSRRPLDSATMTLSVLGIGAAGAIIGLAIMKLPR